MPLLKPILSVALVFSWLILGSFSVTFAQSDNGITPTDSPTDLDQAKKQLLGIEDTLNASTKQRHKIESDVEAIQADRTHLVPALIDTAARVQNLEAKIAENEIHLKDLDKSLQALKTSLDNRREVIAEVLAVLQRMGRKQPPALLVRPEDILAAIRVSILLGDLLPEMRTEILTLTDDLKDLVRLTEAAKSEAAQMHVRLSELAAERDRLEALIQMRQQNLNDSSQALAAEKLRADQLALEANSLKDLIAKMENDAASSNRIKEQNTLATENNSKQKNGEKDTARLSPEIAFVNAKGTAILPVSGQIARNYGVADGYGGSEKGLSILTQNNATVVAPADSWVLFSGPWRSYGQILILNAGGGYYIVLAGLKKIDVTPGQFVLMGEPLGNMGNGLARSAASVALGESEPVLYIEFRKDGMAIDPSPWWVKPSTEKVRG